MFRLPPGLPGSPSQGVLTISFQKLHFLRLSLTNIRASFKFWGEQEPHTVSWSSETEIRYEITTNYESFVDYLRDMKVLMVEFRDTRTGKLVATGIVNLRMVTNGFQFVEGDWEWLVSIEDKKMKVGEFMMGWQYRVGAKRIHTNNQHSHHPLPSNTDNAHRNPHPIYPNPTPIRPPNTITHPQVPSLPSQSSNVPVPYFETNPMIKYKRRDILEQFKQQGILNGRGNMEIPRINYQYQYSKLKLQEMELTNDEKMGNELTVMFCEVESLKNMGLDTGYRLDIEFPIISDRHPKLNHFQIWSLGVSQQVILFNQKVSIVIDDHQLSNAQLKEYLSAKLILRLSCSSQAGKEKEKQGEKQYQVAYGEISLASLLTSFKKSKSVKVRMVGKKTKSDKNLAECELILRQVTPTSSESQKNIPINPNPNPTLIPNPPSSNNPSLVPPSSLNLQIMIHIGKFRMLDQIDSPNIYIRLLIGKNTFKSDPVWNRVSPDFDMILYVPLPPQHHNLGFITLEVWNRKGEETLIGTGKVSLEKLKGFSAVSSQCELGSSIMPYCLFDQDKEISSLSNGVVGYLEVKMAVGTPEQGFNFHKRTKQLREFIQRQKVKPQTNKNLPPIPNQGTLAPNTEVNIPNPILPPAHIKQPSQHDPSESSIMSSDSPSSKNNIIDQLEPTPTLSSLLFYFLYTASSNPNYYKLLHSLISQTSLSMSKFISLFKFPLQLKVNERDCNRLCYFFVRDLQIPVNHLIKAIETYRQYQQLINDSFNPALANLKQQMEYEMVSVTQLEIHLKKFSTDTQSLKRMEFKQGILELLEVSLVDLDLLFQHSRNSNDQVNIQQFSHSLRAYDTYQTIRFHRYSYEVFTSYMYRELKDVVQDMPQLIQSLLQLIGDRREVINCYQLIQLFQEVEIELSLWEGFVLIQSIKEESPGVVLEEGLLAVEMLSQWLQKLLPARIFRSPTFGLIHSREPTEREEKKKRKSKESMYKLLSLHFSFGVKPCAIFLFGEQVGMEFISITETMVEVGRDVEEYKMEIVLKEQVLSCEGRLGVWVQVTEDGGYVGDVMVQEILE